MAFAFIDLKRQYLSLQKEIQAEINQTLESTQFINGPQVREFEEDLAEYVGVKEVISCGNGTSSLEMALMALGLGRDEVVFCPSFTFMATAEVIALRGGRPVFVDIDPETYNMDAQDLERKIKAVLSEGRYHPRGIIAVDLFGQTADYLQLEPLATKYNLFLLEDAAQGFGGAINQRRAASFGQIGSTSFFPAKPLGCYGDGGALFTNSSDLAETLRSLRTHGSGKHKYEHLRIGFNSRLDSIQAAVLKVKLRAFPREMEERQRVADVYTRKLAGAVPTPKVPENFQSSWAQYTLRVPADQRARIMKQLHEAGLPTMIYYPRPLHLQAAFGYLGWKTGDLPQSERASQEVLSLPMHPYLSDEEAEQISEMFLKDLR